MAERNDTGREGEEEARAFLVKKGYTVLHTNWHWHHFELDIVAIDGDMLVVVEVKTRAMDYLISPEDAVDRKKMRRTVMAADAYVRYFSMDMPVRFDIITVVKKKDGYIIDHIDDAFLPPVK
ncbi:YraN family protein [Parabacteroides sp. 52]|uniref:YraN family protein n=1 Tax=unclassified Parabacteroides TaxID=2649774 RepID=UPI0013D4EB97|nr:MULTISPECIES: YraN family protein [unclassified Parabacteroides]MDH6534337.1 putative endonuclease [Parabacteroides sp. PM5-20]NDV54835.1 YraN family protein [Parabacteroides sp. 52]